MKKRETKSLHIDLKLLVSICFFLVLMLFLASYFKPSLIFSDTTTVGGDTGSHNLLAWHLKTKLLPQGRIIGWCPQSFAGFPLFQYYFPLPYFVIALASFLIPFNIAFKLTTIAGVCFLPIAVFLSFRAMKFKYPVALTTSALCLLFLFKEEGIAAGGTIKSMLAGQFPYSIALALMVLALGFIYKGCSENRLVIGTSLLIAAIVLCHGFALIPLMLASLFFVFEDIAQLKVSKTVWLAKVFGLGFCLSGFWSIPYLFKREWAMIVLSYSGLSASLDFLITPRFAIPMSIALLGLLLALILKQECRRQLYILFWFLALVGFTWAMKSSLLQTRYANVMFLFALLAAGGALKVVSPYLRAVGMLPLIALLTIMIFIKSDLKEIPHWIEWNYQGAERKNGWPDFRDINAFFAKTNFSGRIDFEYYNYNPMGSPRIFELSPMFHHKPVMEGLLFESSLTYPFFFYLQKRVSESCWWPGFPIKMPQQDLNKAMNDLKLFNVRYLVARHAKTKQMAASNPDLILEKEIGQMRIYRVASEGRYVTALKKEPVLIKSNDWKPWAYAWMGSDRRDVFLIFTGSKDQKDASDKFNIEIDGEKYFRQGEDHGKVKVLYNLLPKIMDKSRPYKSEAKCVIQETVASDRIRFTTTCVGRPHLIKTTYFPNWKVRGAARVFHATPSLMMVIPGKNEVELYYGRLPEDILGMFVSGLAVLGVLGVLFFPRIKLLLRLNQNFSNIENTINATLDQCQSVLARRQNKNRLLGLMGIIILTACGFLTFRYFMAIHDGCDAYCQNGGSEAIDPAVLDLEDEIRTGFAYSRSKKEHHFVCENGALCDKTRPKYVYVNSGRIRFTLKGQKGRDHVLTIQTFDNFNCRSNTVFCNGKKLGKMVGYGENPLEKQFKFFIPSKLLKQTRARVAIVKEDDACFGFDIAGAKLSSIGCDCPETTLK